MKECHDNNVEGCTSTTSFENMLLFLLSHVSNSDGRDTLKEELAKLYAWAVQIVNYPPAGASTSNLDASAGNVTNDSKNGLRDVGKFSDELIQYLQE